MLKVGKMNFQKKEVRVEHISEALQNLSPGAPTQNQKIIEPEPDELTLEEKREELRKSLGVSSLENTFRNFKLMPGTEKSLAAFKALAEGTTNKRMLLCYGGVGNGKTYLCEATAITLYKRDIFCRVMTMARIMRALKQCMGLEPLAPYDELLDRYCHCGHLIVDDVGMGGSGSDWEYGQLEEIVVARYRERLFTIMTTNRDLSELPERIVSRFRDPDVGSIILNQGEDFRRLKGVN